MRTHLLCFLCGAALAAFICLRSQDTATSLPPTHSPTTTAAGGRSPPPAYPSNQGGTAQLRAPFSNNNGSSARHLLYQGGSFLPSWRREFGEFKSRWHPTVLESVFRAQQKLHSTREERANRIIVPMLSNRHTELCCMLTDLNNKVAGTNAMDVFVFTVDNRGEQVYQRSPCWRRALNLTVVFLPLDEHWGVDPASSSSAYHDQHGWAGMPGLFGESYRQMGHWRLTFQFAFADMLGYRWMWQLDDDSFFKSPVDINVIEYMKARELWVAGFKTTTDPFVVAWSLPELARLYLVAERLAPAGTLFSNHTQPPGLEGLYTVRNKTERTTQQPLQGDPGGWSRAVIHGNCVIMDLDKFWWPKEHQKFVELVVQTGFHWRFRWNEQGVMAMLWQLFVPQGHFQFDTLPFDYVHGRKAWGDCSNGTVQPHML